MSPIIVGFASATCMTVSTAHAIMSSSLSNQSNSVSMHSPTESYSLFQPPYRQFSVMACLSPCIFDCVGMIAGSFGLLYKSRVGRLQQKNYFHSIFLKNLTVFLHPTFQIWFFLFLSYSFRVESRLIKPFKICENLLEASGAREIEL